MFQWQIPEVSLICVSRDCSSGAYNHYKLHWTKSNATVHARP